MKKLFVSGFPLEITEMELAVLIAPYGDIDTIKIVRDKKTKKCKGYAFIEMMNAEGAKNAAGGLHGQYMKGRELTVNINSEPVEASESDIQVREVPFTRKTDPVRVTQKITTTEPEKLKRPRRARL